MLAEGPPALCCPSRVAVGCGAARGPCPERCAGRLREGPGCVAAALTAPVPLFQGKGSGKEPAEPGAAAGPVVLAGDGCVRVAVRAKPGARCSAVTGGSAWLGTWCCRPGNGASEAAGRGSRAAGCGVRVLLRSSAASPAPGWPAALGAERDISFLTGSAACL